MAEGRVPLLVSCLVVRLSPKFETLSEEDSSFLNRSILLSLSAPRELSSEESLFLGLLLTACSGIAALDGRLP